MIASMLQTWLAIPALLSVTLNASKLKLSPILEVVILAITAYWIIKYTRETQSLRELAVQQRVDSVRPIVTFQVVGPYKVAIANIGKGPALDIEFRLSQIHETGGLTNLRNLIVQDEVRDLLNLGESERAPLPSSGSETIRQYALAQEPDWAWGQRGVFAVIAGKQSVAGLDRA
jgi:hypothetical protein